MLLAQELPKKIERQRDQQEKVVAGTFQSRIAINIKVHRESQTELMYGLLKWET